MIKSLIPLFTIASIATAHADHTGGIPPGVPQVVLEADNGAVFRVIDITRIDNRWRGFNEPYASAMVINEDGRGVPYTFTCDGDYASGYTANWQHIPSRSVLAKIGQIACQKIKR